MNALERIARAPLSALELTNILLTTDDAVVGATPREVVWTHRGVTLYRYASAQRIYPVPLLLVFALINRPEIFDLAPGRSLVEFLLGEGFDVFLVDWGHPDEEDADFGLDNYVCDELHWAIRETLRCSGADELTLMGWCIGATLCAMYCGLQRDAEQTAVRNLALLTMPIDGRASTYARWVGEPRLRLRPDRRAVSGAARRRGRHRQQAAQAGDELLDDLPAARCIGVRWIRAAETPTSRWPSGWPITRISPAARGRSGSS